MLWRRRKFHARGNPFVGVRLINSNNSIAIKFFEHKFDGTALAGSKPTPTPTTSTLSRDTRIGFGVSIAVAVIAISLLGTLLWRGNRKGTSPATATKEGPNAQDKRQPYLQQKSELKDEERRKHELEATERRYEFDEDDNIHEMPAEADSHGTPTLRARQELRGAEYAQELGVPQ